MPSAEAESEKLKGGVKGSATEQGDRKPVWLVLVLVPVLGTCVLGLSRAGKSERERKDSSAGEAPARTSWERARSSRPRRRVPVWNHQALCYRARTVCAGAGGRSAQV